MTEVFRNRDAVAVVGDDWLRRLKENAAAAPKRRARLCLHADDAAPVHQMVVALCADSAIAPHRHDAKPESFHVVDGDLAILLFADDGAVERVIRLGAPGSGKPFMCRIAASAWHSVVAESTCAIFHETTAGPFRADAQITAPWAPRTPEAILKFNADALRIAAATSADIRHEGDRR